MNFAELCKLTRKVWYMEDEYARYLESLYIMHYHLTQGIITVPIRKQIKQSRLDIKNSQILVEKPNKTSPHRDDKRLATRSKKRKRSGNLRP